MLNITVRYATPSDAQAFATIQVLGWQCAYKNQIPDTYLDSLSIEKKTETWKESLSHPKQGVYYFIAEIPGQTVGWCVEGTSRDEDTIQLAQVGKDMNTNVGELHGIYVHPDYIGQGVGTKLMQHALNTLAQDGFKKATLWVLDTNQKTRTFYEKRGWQIEGKTKIDHRDGFDMHETRYIISL